MIDIRYYLTQNTIDGHRHLFDKDGCVPFDNSTKIVGFCDIEPKYIDSYKSTIKYYEDFIKNHYNENITLLATSLDEEEMIEMHKKWPDIIKGFGEVKCYKEWKGVELKLDRLSKYWKMFKYAGENNLPVYIHYSLNTEKEVKKFENILKRFPNTIFVLCHCGMDEWTNNDFCHHTLTNLLYKYKNLIIDISFKAMDYYSDNPLKITQLSLDRVFIGTDENRISLERKGFKRTENDIKKWHIFDGFIKSDKNLNKLFK